MKVVAVVPAYNEESTVSGVLRSLSGLVDEIIVVNDGSTDRTGELAVAAGVRVVTHVINRGLGAAIGTGLLAALRSGADFIVTFDADDQHRAEDIARMVEPLRRGSAEVTIGTRYLDRHLMPKTRRLANWLANLQTFLLFGKWVNDSQSGLRGFTRGAALQLDLRSNRMEVSSEIIGEINRNDLMLEEVLIRPDYSAYSLSKGQGFYEGLKTAWKLFLHRVMR